MHPVLNFLKKTLSGTLDIQLLSKNHGLGIDERVIEYPWLFSRLSKNKSRLLAAGSILNFEYILDQTSLKKKKKLLFQRWLPNKIVSGLKTYRMCSKILENLVLKMNILMRLFTFRLLSMLV